MLLKTWKNIIISSRLKIMDHLITILLRLFHIEDTNPEFAINQIFSHILDKSMKNPYLILNFKTEDQLNFFEKSQNSENYEIEENLKAVLLEKIDSLVKMISYINGVYNIDAELYYAEITLHYLEKGDMNKLYCLDTFIELFNNKKQRFFSLNIKKFFDFFMKEMCKNADAGVQM